MLQDPVRAAGRVDTTFVGRAEELGLFKRTLDQVLGGHRQILLLSGEPGIGKSRCAEAFAQAAEEQGALVVWGRCSEEPGAPPYWPWVQILREFIDASSPSEVRFAMAQGVSDIAAIVPELADGDSAPASAATLDPSETRFRMFDAIARFFAKATQQVPLVAIIDDLHWADAPSLSLLEFLSHELQRCRLLIVGTYRENEVSRKSPLQHTLGGLGKDAGGVRMRLAGLPVPAIATLAQSLIGPDLPSAAIAAIHHQTDGNPLFVIELLKVLIDESRDAGVEPIAVRIPDGVREAIGRRLDRLSARGNEVLITASVIGRVFGAAEVSAALGDDFARVLEHLEAATQTGIIERCGDATGEYRFTHALIRETLYDEIPRLDRLRLHGRVADALVAGRPRNVEPVLSRIAHHYHEAAMLGYVEQAAEYAARAAEHASRMQAYEEALTHYDRVIDVLTLSGQPSDERVARAMFLKGRALCYLGAYGDAAQALLKAVHAIRSSGNAEFVVDVVSQLVFISATGPQREIVPLLETALTLLADDAHKATRAKAIASLALALRSSGDYERIEQLTDQAVELATRLDDPLAADLCLCLSLLALRGRPQTLERRLAIGELHVEVARRADSQHVLARAGFFQMEHLLEQGRIDESAAITEQTRRLSCHYAQKDYLAANNGIVLTLLRGEWLGLEERIEALRELGSRTRRDDAEGVYGAQMFALKRDLGQLSELEPLVRSLVEAPGYRAWAPGLIVVCTELGLVEHSRSLLDRLAQNDFAQLPRDDMFVACLTYCSEACVLLGDSVRAATIYRLLLPYSEQTLNHPRAVCFGSAQLFLGLLAHTAGDDTAAREHFERAVARNREMRAWPWLARTLYHYGSFLLQADRDHEREHGRRFLTEADQLAGRLSMAALGRDIDRLLRGTTGDSAFPDGLTVREIDVLRLVTIGRSNKDISKALTISLNTVATHVRSILNKTGCANRTEAAAYAMHNELQLVSTAEHPTRQPAQPSP